MKRKVLIVTDFFYPHWTGISKSVYYLISAVDAESTYDILTVRYDTSLKKRDKIFNTNIFRENSQFSLSRSKYSFSLIFRFLSIIHKYDTVFVNSPCSNVLPVSLITKVFRKNLLIFHQGDLVLPKSIVNKIIEKTFDFSTFLSIMICNKVSTYTKDYALNSRILKYFLPKFTPLLIPINTNVYKMKKMDKTKIIFGFAGRFVEEKGFDILLDVIPDIVIKFPNSEFFYAGELNISYEKFFEKNYSKYQTIKKYITILGLLDDKEMNAFYKSLDFIIVPSRTDCFNLVQTEAMLNGVPSICSNIPGLRYMVAETGFGVLFESENREDLVNKIIGAVEARKKIMLAYENVVRLLNYNKNVKKIKKFIGT